MNARPSWHAGLAAALLAASLAVPAAAAAPADPPYVNGGITQDEADAMRAQAPRYPLEVTLARKGEAPGHNEFVAEAHLRVTDAAGHVVIERGDTGPMFLASLPDGRYVVEASYNGQTKSQRVDVKNGHHAAVTFLWN